MFAHLWPHIIDLGAVIGAVAVTLLALTYAYERRRGGPS